MKLQLQYFGHLMRRADSLENILMLGKTGQKEKGEAEYEFEQTLGNSGGQWSHVYCNPWGLKESDMT